MGCFWGWRDNNSYVSTHQTDKVCAEDNSKCFNYSDVFVDEVVPGYSNTCGQTCYVACSCNTSNGWYSSCQGSDCFSVTDTRYAGKPNAASASRSLSDIGSISASGANSGISTMASGATTCYKDCKDEDPCLGVTCGMNAHCKDGECVCDDDYYYIFLGSDTAKKYGCPLTCPICEYSSCIMDCIDNPTYRDTQECIEMICAPGCGLHGEFTKPADNYYEQEGVSGDYGCYNYDFNYKCPDNIPFPYNPNGEKCCCVDLNWVGGSGPGNIQIPTSCVCYGTVTRP